jgi:hypothetical protein
MTMRRRLLRLYHGLPLVRELRDLRSRLHELQRVEGRRLRLDIDAERARLLGEERYRDPRCLARHERQVFSQNGEDGAIAEILRRVGNGARTFLEIGVGDGLENNTLFLLSQGWKGFWVEADPASAKAIRKRFRTPIAEGRLRVAEAFATAESIEGTLRELGVPEEPDLFSLDIDRNTYWIWAALKRLRPRVSVIEYNALFPPDVDWKVDYDPRRVWDGTSHFGASLKAMERLAAERGERLVGCDLCGANAYFVRADLCDDRFEGPFTAERHHEPPRYHLSTRMSHPPGFDG